MLDQQGYDVFLLYYISRFHQTSSIYGAIYGHTVAVFHDEGGKLNYITNVVGSNRETLFSIFGPFDRIDQIISNEGVRTRGRVFLYGFTHLGSIGEQMEPRNFTEAIDQLSSPPKVLNYMARNFQFNIDRRPPLSPQQLFQTKEGNTGEYVRFISYLLNQHSYNTQMLYLEITVDGIATGREIMVIYWDADDNLRSISHHGEHIMRVSQPYTSLNNLIRHVEETRSLSRGSEVRVSRFGFLTPNSTNLQPTEWITFSSK